MLTGLLTGALVGFVNGVISGHTVVDASFAVAALLVTVFLSYPISVVIFDLNHKLVNLQSVPAAIAFMSMDFVSRILMAYLIFSIRAL
jgi:hypothetical protein